MTKTRRIPLAVALAAAALSAAGCGGSGSGSGSGSDNRAKLEQAQLKFAECMRRNGVDVPDPKPGGGAVMIAPRPTGGSPARAVSAQKKCAHFLDDVPPPKLSAEQKTEMRDAALAHARCMRSHGIDFPDPTFGADGSIKVRIGGGVDPLNPRFRRAEAACQKEAPNGLGGPGNPVPAGP